MEYSPNPRNLNELVIDDDAGGAPQNDYSIRTGNGVEVHFKHLESRLVAKIHCADVILGCVAWLTSEPILRALATKPCQIIVQKEDFLRPDLDSSEFGNKLRQLYDAVPRVDGGFRYSFPGLASSLSTNGGYESNGVRCVGAQNTRRAKAWPRMHHKFVVFCSRAPDTSIIPYAVWTGSFNFTRNGNESFENAVYIANPEVADAYANEYGQILALSEPLNWEKPWVSPEYRIGT